jgi:hypothetical protein
MNIKPRKRNPQCNRISKQKAHVNQAKPLARKTFLSQVIQILSELSTEKN